MENWAKIGKLFASKLYTHVLTLIHCIILIKGTRQLHKQVKYLTEYRMEFLIKTFL